MLAAVSAAALAFPLSWALDTFGGHQDSRATITVNQRTDHRGIRYTNSRYTLEARTDTGTPLDLDYFGANGLYASLNVGDPVVVTRSTITGDVVSVRTAIDSASSVANLGVILLEVLLPLALPFLLVIPLRNLLYRVPRRVVFGVPAVAFAVSLTVVLLNGPELGQGEPGLPPAATVEDPATSTTVVTADQSVTTGNLAVTLAGPVSDRPPAGAAAWLHGFSVVSIPVTARLVGPNTDGDHTGLLYARLAGDGVGRAEAVGAPACTHQSAAEGFGNAVSIDQGTTAHGVLCFVLPTGFQPRYLVLTDTDTNTGAIDLNRHGS